MNADAVALLAATVQAYETAEWRAEPMKAALEAIGAERGLKLGKAQAPVRVAVTGRTVGLPPPRRMRHEELGHRSGQGSDQDQRMAGNRPRFTHFWP